MSDLKQFHCTACNQVALVRGGTSGFRCPGCRTESPALLLQRAAHKAVADAIRAGTLARPHTKPCTDCSGEATQYDHRDYSAPLVVAPVCRRCNLARGSAIGSPALRRQGAPAPCSGSKPSN